MASIRKRGQNSYLIVVSRGYDYEGNRLKAAQKTVHPPKDLTPGQCKKWLNEQAVLFEREVRHDPQPVNPAMTLAAYTEHWLRDIAPGKLAASTYSRDQQDIRRILPALGHYKLTDLRKETIRAFYEAMRSEPKLTDGQPLGHPAAAGNQLPPLPGITGGIPAPPVSRTGALLRRKAVDAVAEQRQESHLVDPVHQFLPAVDTCGVLPGRTPHDPLPVFHCHPAAPLSVSCKNSITQNAPGDGRGILTRWEREGESPIR